jgi:hypothetical protein
LGLRALRSDEPWLELDKDLASDLRTKLDLLREQRAQVFVELPDSERAQREVLSVVTQSLLETHPDLYSRNGNTLRVHATGEEFDLSQLTRPALEVASRCVQEDLVIMQEIEAGWCLTAASVCFPTRWDLPAQLGLPMSEIHKRVPGYEENLGAPSTRFFDGMKKQTSVFRRGNWSLMDDPTLFQPTGKLRTDPSAEVTPDNAGEKVWLRVEHQTVQYLPQTGAILFGIRIHRTRLDAVARNREVAASLIQAIATMKPEMQLYKSLETVRAAAVEYLARAIDAA